MGAVMKCKLTCDICRTTANIDSCEIYKLTPINETEGRYYIKGFILSCQKCDDNEIVICVCEKCYNYFVSDELSDRELTNRRLRVLRALGLTKKYNEMICHPEDRVDQAVNIVERKEE